MVSYPKLVNIQYEKNTLHKTKTKKSTATKKSFWSFLDFLSIKCNDGQKAGNHKKITAYIDTLLF